MPDTMSIMSIQQEEWGWLDVKEATTLEGVSQQAFSKKLTKGGFPAHLVRRVQGTKGEKWQIHVTALSKEAQARYRNERATTIDDRVDAILAKQTEDPSHPTQAMTLNASSKELRKAARKATLVEDFKKLGSKAEKIAFAKEHKTPLSSLYRWCAKYDGSAGSLIRPFGLKTLSIDRAAARQMAADLYRRPERPNPEQVLRAMASTMGEATPSRATLYRWLVDEGLLGGKGTSTYIRHGEKVYRDTCEPIRRRDWSLIPVNHTWVGDHHEMDVLVVLPDATVGRPWLTAWQDGHSRAIVGYTVNTRPCSQEIGLALRNGILLEEGEPYQGIPGQVYVDNGKDYRSKLLNGTTVPVFRQEQADPIWGLLGHLGIKTRFCEPYHGKSKPIERFFGTLEKGWVCLMKGYCGRSPQHRPEQLEADVKATKRWMESGGTQGQRRLMTLWEAEVEFAEAIRSYNLRAHTALGWTAGQGYATPAEAYAAGLPASVKVPTRETLDVLILPSASRKVRNDGIQLARTAYWHQDLVPLIGQDVEVRYNPRDRQEILVLRKGAFVAWAQAQTGVVPFAETEEEIDELRAFLAGNARIRREYRERRKALLSQNPLAAMTPATRELAAMGEVIPLPHVTGYDRAVRAAAKAKRNHENVSLPTSAQAVAVGELLVWEFQKTQKDDKERRAET